MSTIQYPRGPGELKLEVEPSVVTITRDAVVIEPKKSEMPASIARRYRRNSFLLGVAVVAASFWFYLHVKTFFSQWLILGFPILMTLWQLIYARSSKALEKKIEAIRDKWLARESTTRQLLGFCLAALVFLLFTSSVWVTLGNGPVKAATIDVVNAAGDLVVPTLRIDSSSRIAGRPLFPRFFPDDVRLIVRDPKRYVLKNPPSRRLWPWTPLKLDFTTDFEKKPVRVLRIVPGLSLRELLKLDTSDFSLTVQGIHGPARTIDRYPFRTLYVGIADPKDLQDFHDEHNDLAFAEELAQGLIDEGAKLANAQRFAAHWRAHGLLGQMHDFRPGETITVTLRGPEIAPIVRTVTLEDEITLLKLEKTP